MACILLPMKIHDFPVLTPLCLHSTVSQWLYKGEELVGFRTSDSYEMQQIASKAVATSESLLESLLRSSSGTQGASQPDSEYEILLASDNIYDPAALAQQLAAKQNAGSISFELTAIGAGSAADSDSENFYVEEEDAYTESYDDKFIAALEDLDVQMLLVDGQLRMAELAEEGESAGQRGEGDDQHGDEHHEQERLVERLHDDKHTVQGEQRQEEQGGETEVRAGISSRLQVKAASADGGKKAASRNWFGW